MFSQIKHTLVAAGFLAASALSHAGTSIPPTPPVGVYNFSGTCTDCPSPPTAPDSLAVQAGTPATAKLTITESHANWAFEYHSTLFDLFSGGIFIEVAGLGSPDAQGNADAFILFGAAEQFWLFTSDLAGNWSLNLDALNANINQDIGIAGVWAPAVNRVPEPATLLMVALGLVAVSRRRVAH